VPVLVARPPAVVPRPHHEDILSLLWTLRLDRTIRLERPPEIFGVEPSSDGHDRRFHISQVRARIARLPKRVAVPMHHEVVPERDLALEDLRLDVRDGPEREEEVVDVADLGRVIPDDLSLRAGADPPEAPVEVDVVGEEKGSVVMDIVTEETFGDR